MQEKDTSLQTSPQLEFAEHSGVAVALSHKQTISLYKKSKQSGISFDILEEVYRRGFNEALSKDEPADAYAFNRVNSFIAGGAAVEMDQDLIEERKGLWANIHAKRERIKHGSGERMRKPGEKGAPTPAQLKSAKEEYEIDEDSDSGLAAKAKKSGVSIGTLRKVYRRGVAAWNSGHRPGTTPQQWGMARVNSYITKGKTYHTADKDLREMEEAVNAAQQAAIAIAMKKAGKKPKNEEKEFAPVKHDSKTGLPQKYRAGLSDKTAAARKAHWAKTSKMSDSDPRAYEPAPGDASAKTKESKYTKKYREMYGEETKLEEKYGKGYVSPESKIRQAMNARGVNIDSDKHRQEHEKLQAQYQAILDKEKKQQKESYTGAETVSADKNDPSSRFIGTDSIVNVYKADTPGYPEHTRSKTFQVVKKVVKEQIEEEYVPCENCTCGFAEEYITERGADSKGYKRSTESGAGLTAKGVAHYRRQNPGSKLSTAVTEKNPKGRRAARRRSFCARMSGVKGPMKDEKGRPTRKAMSLRRWRC